MIRHVKIKMKTLETACEIKMIIRLKKKKPEQEEKPEVVAVVQDNTVQRSSHPGTSTYL